jgi:hypothetical protein
VLGTCKGAHERSGSIKGGGGGFVPGGRPVSFSRRNLFYGVSKEGGKDREVSHLGYCVLGAACICVFLMMPTTKRDEFLNNFSRMIHLRSRKLFP